jgi:NADH-quinone oxidoreductase subunit G
MTDDTITIELDGKPVQARKGQMLIEVTDANNVYVPRFCYHEKLTVAANCRMCLVEVEKAPKPLPACATPVMDGMIVHTQSEYARNAQKSVMEFLLINHPLDCPICDQGGECELQDLAMGYGSDVSRYQEKKRVVKDQDIGPLVQTEMTRCIHCTRCVRFGEEIAGLRELGATGRSENMEIGTYVEKSMVSELSGNVIDVCPVGALTSKPFRFSARTWEMTQHPGIAPHDGIGSNIHFHIKGDEVKRVVPAQNEAINEVWLSDRDRFSYEGLYSSSRLTVPMIKNNGEWKEIDWSTAIDKVSDQLKLVAENNPQQLGAIISPTSTSEEAYLLQKIVRNLGCKNIDHRIHQGDFSDQKNDPIYPWLGQSIADLENLNAVLLVGANPRKQQPLLNLRLRKATLKGADILVINSIDYDFNYCIDEQTIVPPMEMAKELSAILKAVTVQSGSNADLAGLLKNVDVNEKHKLIASKLLSGDSSAVLVGNTFTAHTQYSILRFLAGKIAELTSSTFGYLGNVANESGCWLAGAVPHRGPAAEKLSDPGLNVLGMLESNLKSYLLFNLDPLLDCWDSKLASNGLGNAESVIAFTAYKTKSLEQFADILLPLSLYAENDGSYINVEGTQQTFNACVAPAGESRPGWKILRVLANKLGIDNCEYETVNNISYELNELTKNLVPQNLGHWGAVDFIPASNGSVVRISEMPMNSSDLLVRHAESLQATIDVSDGLIHINQKMADSIGVTNSSDIKLQQQDEAIELSYVIDERVSDNTVFIHAGHPDLTELGAWFSDVTISKV